MRFSPTLLERRARLEGYSKVSCASSAASKGIPLAAELKSLVLVADGQTIMAHVPGDRRVDCVRVSCELGVSRVRLMPLAELLAHGLEKGRVNPFTAAHYLGRVRHVVCDCVFANETVHTNNDRVGGWLSFKPQYLLHWLDDVCVRTVSVRSPHGFDSRCRS